MSINNFKSFVRIVLFTRIDARRRICRASAIIDRAEINLGGIRSATGSWGSRGGGGGGMIAGSPGVGGMSNSSSSSGASWRSGTPSPPLSEEGVPTRSSPCPATSHPSHNQPHYPYNASGSSSSSTPGSTTLDEGIVPDYIEEQHPRKKVSNLFHHRRATMSIIHIIAQPSLNVLIGCWGEEISGIP